MKLPFSSSKPRAFCASMMVWASSAKDGDKADGGGEGEAELVGHAALLKRQAQMVGRRG